jgi:TetR/AcrR family transcriptional regulator, mexJK operon transcriptional repressor
MSDPSQAELLRAPLRPAAGRPTKAQAEARETELLDVALELFLDQGYAQTTVEAVAAAVGMTKRTVYARHPDKAALFLAAVRRAIERTQAAPEALAALDTGELESTLIAFARWRVGHVARPEGLRLQRVLATESYRFPEIFTWSFEDGVGPALQFLTAVLEHHTTAGTVCLDRPTMAANTFMSMVVGGPVRIIVSGNPLSQAEIDERISYAVRLFLDGARPRKAT